MTKRNLFNEINEGFKHLQKARSRKATLLTVERDYKPAAIINADEVVAIREWHSPILVDTSHNAI